MQKIINIFMCMALMLLISTTISQAANTSELYFFTGDVEPIGDGFSPTNYFSKTDIEDGSREMSILEDIRQAYLDYTYENNIEYDTLSFDDFMSIETGNDNFSPARNITRAEAAKMLYLQQ